MNTANDILFLAIGAAFGGSLIGGIPWAIAFFIVGLAWGARPRNPQ